MIKRILLLIFILSQFLILHSQSKPDIFGSINARQIGPAVMSGRITSIAGVNTDPLTVYVGAAAGGVWKTTNGGTTFKPLFDEHTQSIGTIAIDQKHPDTIWVGTGETNVRNSVSVGDGIYRSTDGGKNWQHLGLENSERIAKIIIHPENPDIVFAAVMGNLWNSSEDRGVYKTTNSGKSWEKILYVDENTGCSDISISPQDPDLLIAGMWEFRRTPYSFKSGGKGSGLYISKDGGSNWEQIDIDKDAGELGRISVSFSEVDPAIAYALVESKNTSLYRSLDEGKTWEKRTSSSLVSERPFYFSALFPDPVDTNKIYKPGLSLYVSKDGGKIFNTPFIEGGRVHSDHHALWINPKNNSHLYLGTDGGLYISYDKGSTWNFCNNLPLSQFYHVAVDNQKPFNVYGGLQDNGSWFGPSKSPGGITNSDWESIGFGDGFNVIPDRTDDRFIYWQWQGGNTIRYNRQTKEAKEITPYSDDTEIKLRFNWNTPIIQSPTLPGVLYIGSQYLFRSTDRGNSWEKISPDLTTNDPQKLKQETSGGLTTDYSTAENHGTIFTISESPLNEKIVWVGTDDGRLHVTSNGGKSWVDVTSNIPQLPENTWVSYAEASHHSEETAFITFDGHRTGDKSVYVFKTTDLGSTWNSITASEIEGYAHVIKQDHKNPDLLFLGTEFGLYISISGGNDWYRFKGNFPKVSVRDIAIHNTQHDVAIATHGRGIFIIDDITPLRGLTNEILSSEVTILDSRPFEITIPKFAQGGKGDAEYIGNNPVEAAYISYYLKKRHIFGQMYLEILDEEGNLIKKLPAGKDRGMNRVGWYIRKSPPKIKAISPLLLFRTMYGPTYPAGNYKVRLVKGDEVFEGSVSLIYDTELPHSKEDRDLQYATLNRSYELLQELGFVTFQVQDLRDKLLPLKEYENANKLVSYLNTLEDKLISTSNARISARERLREKIGNIYGAVLTYQGKPTNSQLERLDLLESEFESYKKEFYSKVNSELVELNKRIIADGKTEISLADRKSFENESN